MRQIGVSWRQSNLQRKHAEELIAQTRLLVVCQSNLQLRQVKSHHHATLLLIFDLMSCQLIYWSICWDGFKVFKKPDDPEKLDEEVSEETSRRFEYDPWSGRGIAFTVTSTVVLIVLGEFRQNYRDQVDQVIEAFTRLKTAKNLLMSLVYFVCIICETIRILERIHPF